MNAITYLQALIQVDYTSVSEGHSPDPPIPHSNVVLFRHIDRLALPSRVKYFGIGLPYLFKTGFDY